MHRVSGEKDGEEKITDRNRRTSSLRRRKIFLNLVFKITLRSPASFPRRKLARRFKASIRAPGNWTRSYYPDHSAIQDNRERKNVDARGRGCCPSPWFPRMKFPAALCERAISLHLPRERGPRGNVMVQALFTKSRRNRTSTVTEFIHIFCNRTNVCDYVILLCLLETYRLRKCCKLERKGE